MTIDHITIWSQKKNSEHHFLAAGISHCQPQVSYKVRGRHREMEILDPGRAKVTLFSVLRYMEIN